MIEAHPTLLIQSRAAFSKAKDKRRRHWRLEAAAAAVGLIGAFIPHIIAAAAAGVFALLLKFGARLTASKARSLFRLAERARRYEFERRTLGWRVPEQAYADLRIAFSGEVEEAAQGRAEEDEAYYLVKGPPSNARFFHNLAESLFWTEKLMKAMETVRARHVLASVLGVILSLIGLLFVGPSGVVKGPDGAEVVLGGLRVLGALVSVLLGLDLLGERAAFQRGANESRDLFGDLTAAMRVGSREDGLHVLIEYDCLLADLPMVPDSIYQANRERLTKIWMEVAKSLPAEAPLFESLSDR